MSKLKSSKNKSAAKGSRFINSFVEHKDKDMEDCLALNRLFLELRLEIIKERRVKNGEVN